MATGSVSCLRTTQQSLSVSAREVTIFPPNEVFTDVMYHYFELSMFFIFGSVIAVFGIVSNVINVVVYCRQGVKDSVTVTFIALSLWDFGNCFTSLLSIICFIIESHFPIPTVNFLAIQYVYFGYTRGFTYILSTIVTMHLSIERCICLIVPFKVKEVFTKSRSILINAAIVIFSCACFCPAWATQGLQWEFDGRFNNSRLVLWISINRRDVDVFVDMFNGVVIPTIAQIVITISAVFMLSAVKTSAKFRLRSTGMSAVNEGQSGTQVAVDSKTDKKPNTKDKTMSTKDSKLAKVVIMVAVIFFVCNLPVLIVAVARALVPKLDIGKTYNNLYHVAYILVYDFGLVNSSVNIIVYYLVSSKFKEVFLSLFTSNRKPCTS
ncbi:unnamed protein product [Candidula unifasciata]|uniref:G-protein coupled receptors family 1 profile domain-containing protein n=1 Tax=Candidula unifasciata TaxID=100452 RepID=A0A8S3ZYR7_9EUPU|nr:unnamed protein product [Candidula unifasciata]